MKKELMTHIVVGYPSLSACRELVASMVKAGVAYIELQIPFSDPIADGPTILKANQRALDSGIDVNTCFSFAKEMSQKYPDVRFLFMTYYNIVYHSGIDNFVKRAAKAGIFGCIVPDIPPEEHSGQYYLACKKAGIHPVAVISPTTSPERIEKYTAFTGGFVYCTSKTGITGSKKSFSRELERYVKKVKKQLNIPIAVGFGIDSVEKAKEVRAFADIIVIGSEVIRIVDKNTKNFPHPVHHFLQEIRKVL